MRRVFRALLALLPVVLVAVALMAPAIPAAAQGLYFADGYHGGYFLTSIVGLRDSFKAAFRLLDTYPQYRLNLEIEPYTLEKLKYGPQTDWEKSQVIFSDPSILAAIRRFVSEGRLEMVGGTYTQPLLFAISGESAVRQFLFGTRATRDVVGVAPVTYASQEPCYTSQLPQLLDGFGFRQAVLKNTWALFGNPPAIDRSRVQWEGPDGSRIDTSPRYAFDGYNQFVLDLYPGQGFLDRASRSGLPRPISFNLGDFIAVSGTAGVPWFNEKQLLGSAQPNLEFTTWDQYFRGAPADDATPWKVSYNDFEYRFPWGLLGGRVQKQTAEAERALLRAEKIASIANVLVGASYPSDDLSRAWKDLLLAQHHDAWVCAPTVFGGWVSTRMYADWVDTWTAEAENLAAGVTRLPSVLLRTASPCPQTRRSPWSAIPCPRTIREPWTWAPWSCPREHSRPR